MELNECNFSRSKGVDTEELKSFVKFRDELTASKNIILRGSRLILPQTLRAKANFNSP